MTQAVDLRREKEKTLQMGGLFFWWGIRTSSSVVFFFWLPSLARLLAKFLSGAERVGAVFPFFVPFPLELSSE